VTRALAGELIESACHEAIVTSATAHGARGGRLAARASGLPLVMDMRDPWVCWSEYRSTCKSGWLAFASDSRAAPSLTLRSSRRTLSHSDAPCVIGIRTRGAYHAVMNGCDEDAVPPRIMAAASSSDTLVRIYLDRDPRPLFHAAARVVQI